ncbi:MAG: NAD(P)H-binding protein [Mycobacteriales bacterium]
MACVLVTGATGQLGRVLVPALQAAGHDVRAMTRTAGRVRGADEVVADVLDPASLSAAVSGSDVVLHLASSPGKDARRTEIDGTRNLLAARPAGTALVYLSIVGCDRTPFGYYRAKTAAEVLVRAAPDAFVVRATQFHGFAGSLARPLPVLGRALAPRGARLQPVAESFVAEVLVEAVTAPADAPAEVAGPEQLELAEIARRRSGRRALSIPLPGRLFAAIGRGSLLAGPGARIGGPALS